MFWTILALIFLVALGGFVSYYGDLQGRRWGKRRVSWFGMRPKHTAILITTLTGSSIVILSAAAIMIAVPNVRDVVLRGEHAIRENKGFLTQQKKEREDAAREIARIGSQKQDIQRQLAVSSHDLEMKNQQMAQMTQQVNALKQQAQILAAQDAALLQQQNTMTAAIKKQNIILDASRKENQRLDKENKQQAVWNKTAEEVNRDLGMQNNELTRQNIEITRSNTDLQKDRDKLNKDIADAKKLYDHIHAENDALYEESKSKTLEVQALTRQRTEIMEWIKQRDEIYGQIEGANQNILQSYTTLRRGHLNIRAGSELGRLTIAPHLRPEAVRLQLIQLLMTASEAAHKLGAAPDMNGREVRIVPKRLVTLTGLQQADEKASLDTLSDNLSGRDKPIMVVAHTVNNSVVGEVVLVELQPYQIERVYDQGEKVAARRIDARQPVDKIIENLIQFLQKDVRDAAIKAGTLPKIDPETGLPEIGIIGTGDLFQLTERVRKLGGDVQLTATAKREVSSADPLNLEFKVARISEKTDTAQEKASSQAR